MPPGENITVATIATPPRMVWNPTLPPTVPMGADEEVEAVEQAGGGDGSGHRPGAADHRQCQEYER
jgi:hypothetical protein